LVKQKNTKVLVRGSLVGSVRRILCANLLGGHGRECPNGLVEKNLKVPQTINKKNGGPGEK